MDEIKSFMEENFQMFIDWFDEKGLSDPENYANECMNELEETLEDKDG